MCIYIEREICIYIYIYMNERIPLWTPRTREAEITVVLLLYVIHISLNQNAHLTFCAQLQLFHKKLQSLFVLSVIIRWHSMWVCPQETRLAQRSAWYCDVSPSLCSWEQIRLTSFQHSLHTSGHRRGGAAHLEFAGEEESERRRPLLMSCTSAAHNNTGWLGFHWTAHGGSFPPSLVLTLCSASPNLCRISSRGARWVLARTQVCEGGWDRHVSSFWKRHSASWWPTAANTWMQTRWR